MPQRISWQALDGGWEFALVWFANSGLHQVPELFVHLRSPLPDRRTWIFRLVPRGALEPWQPAGAQEALDQQPEPEAQ
jgi:hypothetical protein